MRNPFKIKKVLQGTSALYYELWGPDCGGRAYFDHVHTLKKARDLKALLFQAFRVGMKHAVRLIDQAEGS